MKKLFAGLVATIMMIGLVSGLTGTAADAAPYPGKNVKTNTHVDAPGKVKRHHRATICVSVSSRSNLPTKGQATIKVKRGKGGFVFRDSKKYKNGEVCFTTPKLHKKGKYTVHAIFDRKPGSGLKDSDNRTAFKVRKRG